MSAKPITNADLIALKEALDALPPRKVEPGSYAALADENDEDGIVNVYNKNGTLLMQMPRSVWDELRAMP